MTRSDLIFKFVGLSALWGLGLGAGLGLIGGILFGALSLSLGGILYTLVLFSLFGAITGILLDGLNGLVLGIIAVILFYPNRVETHFRLAALIGALAISFFSSFFWFSSVMKFYSATGGVELWAVLIPTTVATIAGGYGSQRVVIGMYDRRSAQN